MKKILLVTVLGLIVILCVTNPSLNSYKNYVKVHELDDSGPVYNKNWLLFSVIEQRQENDRGFTIKRYLAIFNSYYALNNKQVIQNPEMETEKIADNLDYRTRVFLDLKDVFGDVFSSTYREFDSLIDNDPTYAKNVFKELKDAYGGDFTRSENEFINLLKGKHSATHSEFNIAVDTATYSKH